MDRVVIIPAIPIRKEPFEQSEMVTQLLFGEKYSVVEKQEKWARIKELNEGYMGWISHETERIQADDVNPDCNEIVNTQLLLQVKKTGSKNSFFVPAASSLYTNNIKEQFFYIGNTKFEVISNFKPEKNSAFELARLYFECPYLWGGRTPMGIDCSGLVQNVFKMLGYKIPRDAWRQQQIGKNIKSQQDVKNGDLAFFSNSEGKITHVGILDGGGNIIHSSGKVRIDILDNTGIFNIYLQEHTHKLHSINRILT